ncbi:Calcium-activated potassium channel slowpoke [Zancudomyces culisetae]|uniref:Calcium-activated potassium channel slowpoke n=1 Tax=Zancudomyces culisetae TaxID=1213189 RepID=A0A1R1PVD7_ZANCU|nr:Calcium-activated potassium channel slowpoke [Zancudomyces culisetae]OMH85923.1 Calcium-activated potassium channel slowpoke [Zancudomyces culisetae]|eukprot:OMH84936.1 Calcium-activated potassium channel slowpoke [Zancudomyces culisetae]
MKNQEVKDFEDVLFFTAVSSVTGLTSDITPDNWYTRGVVVFIMFLGVLWFPPRMAEVLEMLGERNPWATNFTPEYNQKHVLVIGDLSYSSMFEFLREFFCEDHGPKIINTVVVLMSETPPEKNVAKLLKDPAYVENVKFVLGSPTSMKDLSDVKAHRARSIFVLSNKGLQAGGEAADDNQKVMITLAIRRYLLSLNRKVPIYAQALLPETTFHLEYLTKDVICIPELRLGLLAKGNAIPGFSSMLQTMITSIPESAQSQLIAAVRTSPNYKWLVQYIRSLGMEVYATKFSPAFKGIKFQKAVQLVYARYSAILMALVIDPSVGVYVASNFLINPLDYVMTGSEEGFLIGMDSQIAEYIASVPFLNQNIRDPPTDSESGPLLATRSTQGILNSGSGINIMDSIEISHVVKSPTPSHISAASIKSLSSNPITVDPSSATLPPSSSTPLATAEPSLPVQETTAPLILEKPTLTPSSPPPSSAPLQPNATTTSTTTSTSAPAPASASASAPTPLLSTSTPKLSPEGIPCDIKNHVVIFANGSDFPSNMEYLVGCIRSSKTGAYQYKCKSESESSPETARTSSSKPTTTPSTERTPDMGVYSFISPNSTYINIQPVVFLCPAPPSDSVRNILEGYSNVYFVVGSPLVKSDIVRTFIATAASGIVLITPHSRSDVDVNTTRLHYKTSLTITQADTPALMSVLNIESLTCSNPDFRLNVEFNYRENMLFIGSNELIRVNEAYIQPFFRPCFMAGIAYAPIMLDTLICQSFYNENLISILKRLVFSHGDISRQVEYSKLVKAGLPSAHLPPLNPTSPTGENPEQFIEYANVFLVHIPSSFVGLTFSSLFLHALFRHHTLILGLYRNSVETNPSSNFRYFVINPDHSTVLYATDRVYILSADHPQW